MCPIVAASLSPYETCFVSTNLIPLWERPKYPKTTGAPSDLKPPLARRKSPHFP